MGLVLHFNLELSFFASVVKESWLVFLTAFTFLLVGRTWEDQVSNPPVGSNNFTQIADKIMGLIEICNFADEFSLLFNPKLGLCSEWKLTHLFLTAVMFLLVGRIWEDQASGPPVGSNNFLRSASLFFSLTLFRYSHQNQFFKASNKPTIEYNWYNLDSNFRTSIFAISSILLIWKKENENQSKLVVCTKPYPYLWCMPLEWAQSKYLN